MHAHACATMTSLKRHACAHFPFVFRLIGKFKMVLQEVVKSGELNIEEPLLDTNNTALKVRGQLLASGVWDELC